MGINLERELENQEDVIELDECPDCEGLGGYDASTDCEGYDDWQACPRCNGTGLIA